MLQETAARSEFEKREEASRGHLLRFAQSGLLSLAPRARGSPQPPAPLQIPNDPWAFWTPEPGAPATPSGSGWSFVHDPYSFPGMGI